MGKYDFNAELKDDCKLTLTDLIQELMDERKGTAKGELEEATYRAAFKDPKSGLISKIKDKVGIDFDECLRDDSKRIKFDSLKILKCLYEIEKDGIPKKIGGISDRSLIRITNILANPRLENIRSIYSSKSTYGEIFNNLYKKVEEQIPSSLKCKILETLDCIDLEWRVITHRIVSYYLSVALKNDIESAKQSMDLLKNFLDEECLIPLKQDIEKRYTDNPSIKICGVMITFFVILKCHELLCMQTDRITVDMCSIEGERCSPDYMKRYHEMYYTLFNIDDWNCLVKYFENNAKDNISDGFVREVVNLILYDKDSLSQEEIKKYCYVLKKVDFLVKIIQKDGNLFGTKDIIKKVKQQCGYAPIYGNKFISNDAINTSLLIAIIQECFFIVYNPFDCAKKEESLDISYYGYTNKKQTFSSALKKEVLDDVHPIMIMAWVKRIENRILMNMGVTKELLAKRREVEMKALEIQNTVYKTNFIFRIFVESDVITKRINTFLETEKIDAQSEIYIE